MKETLESRAGRIAQQRELDPVARTQMTAAEIQREAALLQLFPELRRIRGFGERERDHRGTCHRLRCENRETVRLERAPEPGGIVVNALHAFRRYAPDRG